MSLLRQQVEAHPQLLVQYGWGVEPGSRQWYDLREIALHLLDSGLTGDRLIDTFSGRLTPGSGRPYILGTAVQIAALTLIAHAADGATWRPTGRISMDLVAA